MKISFDVDGTYSEYQDEFDSLALMLQQSGHEVGFLTGRDEEESPIEKDFELGFEPNFTYYLGLDPDETSDSRCMAKAQKMMEEGIDCHYDDEEPFPDYVFVIHIEPNG